MTIRQKASLAAMLDNLERLARELEAAPTETRASADRYEDRTPGGGAAFQAGSLEQVCKGKALELRALLSLTRQTFPSAANLNKRAA